jgi:F0F1-type ATP synthase alpha subunit
MVIGDRQTKSTVCIDTLNQKEFYDVEACVAAVAAS